MTKNYLQKSACLLLGKHTTMMLLPALFSLTIQFALCQDSEKYYLLKAGQMYDAENNVFLKDQQILIKGKVIVKVGQKLTVPANTEVMDFSTSTVTPGLIDAHTHLLTVETPALSLAVDAVMNSSEKRVLRAARFAKSYLDAGFTTIRDLGNSGQYLDVEVQNAINTGYIKGPRMLVSGPIIGSMDGQFFGLPVKDFERVSKQEYTMISGVEEAKKAVKEHIVRQVDVIKILGIGGRLTLSTDELKAIVETAHGERLKVTAHVDRDWAAQAAIEAGVDGIEHGYDFKDATLEKMAKKGIYFVPTYGSIDQAVRFYKLQNKEIKLSELEKNFKPGYARLKRAKEMGVMIVAGSDAYADLQEPRGESAKQTISGYFDAGLSAQDVLATTTKNAAVALQMKDRIGVIKENAFADITVFNGDMQKDFKKVLFDVKMVMKDGEIQYQK